MCNLKNLICPINSFIINPFAGQICQILQKAGFQAFLVGGCVRDLLIHNSPKDWDIATNALPEQIMELFPKNYPTGLQHGTITVAMGEGTNNHFEITTFRTEGKYQDGRHPTEVNFVQNIEEDLSRRDFTINAMAYNPIINKLIDPFNGQRDLQKGEIKAVGNAQERFSEDGLRIIRAARFAARFRFVIERQTFYAMGQSLDTLKKISKERIKDELCKILMSDHPEIGLSVLIHTNTLSVICPFLTNLPSNIDRLKFQHICQGDLETRVACMYSNCSDLQQIKEELIALKFSNKEIKQIYFLLDLKNRLAILAQNWSLPAYKEFLAHLKNYAGDNWEHTLQEFIKLIKPLEFDHKKDFLQYNNLIVLSRKEMKINGNDLIAAGIPAGPDIKTLLDSCYQEILHHPEHNNKEFLLGFIL